MNEKLLYMCKVYGDNGIRGVSRNFLYIVTKYLRITY